MADIRKYDGVENPSQARELIGTIRPHTFTREKDGVQTKTEGYLASLQLNAAEDRTRIASAANPRGGSDLNLVTDTYQKDGKSNITHNRFYTKEQGDAMIAAAGANNAPYKDSNGKTVKDLRVIAFTGDLVVSKKSGLAVNTLHPMGPSQIADFGKTGAKASKALGAQYDAMKESRALAKEQNAQRGAEMPEAGKEAQAEAETQMGE